MKEEKQAAAEAEVAAAKEREKKRAEAEARTALAARQVEESRLSLPASAPALNLVAAAAQQLVQEKEKTHKKLEGRRTGPLWRCFSTTGCPPEKAACNVWLEDEKTLCGPLGLPDQDRPARSSRLAGARGSRASEGEAGDRRGQGHAPASPAP